MSRDHNVYIDTNKVVLFIAVDIDVETCSVLIVVCCLNRCFDLNKNRYI